MHNKNHFLTEKGKVFVIVTMTSNTKATKNRFIVNRPQY